jgi:ASCH domain
LTALSSLLPARVPAGTRALTIRQPGASLIIEGHKDVENRSWRTNYRGPLIIHAGMALDRDALAKHGHLLRDADNLPRGFLLGTVELVDCIEGAKSRWAKRGAFHWVLSDPRPFRSPVEMRGSLGLWRPIQP